MVDALHPRYAALAAHYAFDPHFCMPARGNEKPDAEITVKAVQRRFATPPSTVGPTATAATVTTESTSTA